jgi:hypothetical protein
VSDWHTPLSATRLTPMAVSMRHASVLPIVPASRPAKTGGHDEPVEAAYFHDQTAARTAHQLNVPVSMVQSGVFYGPRMLRSIICIDATVAVA